MAKALVAYYSKTGHTKAMAARIAEVLTAEGLDVTQETVDRVPVESLTGYDCLVFGSPTYYGTIAWPLKKLIDESVKIHGKLRGKVGGAFTSSGNLAGGNETTVLDILKSLLIHGMIVQGDHQGDHYGPVAVGRPDERSLKSCAAYGQKLARLTRALHPDKS